MAKNWKCPHCDRAVTIAGERESSDLHTLSIKNADGQRTLHTLFYVCPNPECQRFTLTAELFVSKHSNGLQIGRSIQEWSLIPDVRAKQFPAYIPQAILEDYREACLIQVLSPKASATLSRRCLQGIIRDYWGVKPGRLVDEIAAIKPQVDHITWSAIEAVRAIGNIGAHMEKDINVIIDVDPEEAELLIRLVESLLTGWYVEREEKNKRMGGLIAAAAAKKAAPLVVAPTAPAAPSAP